MAESSKQSTDAKDSHHTSINEVSRPPKKTNNERGLLPFESEMVDAASNSSKRVAQSKEYQSLHELHESVVHGTPARLLGSRKTKQDIEKGKHTRLSFLHPGRTDGSLEERVSSDYGDDFLDDDFPSLASLVNPPDTQEKFCQVPNNGFGLNDDSQSKQFSGTLKAGKEFLNKSSNLRRRSPHFLPEDKIDDDVVNPMPSDARPVPQHEFPANIDATEAINPRHGLQPNCERLFVTSSPDIQPESFDARSPARQSSSRGSKRRRSSFSPDTCFAKKSRCEPESETCRAPLAVNPSSQNSQPEVDRELKQAKLIENEQNAPPPQTESLANQDDSSHNDILSRIPKSWGDVSGLDLSLLAEFADYVDFV